jgi:ubiquitin carboxyl-terminal hydrolase 8
MDNDAVDDIAAGKDNSESHAEDEVPLSPASKRNRSEENIKPPTRQSLLRVNSRGDEAGGLFDDVPNSPRARASTYTHVHDAVMYNLSEAERSKHDKSVPMGVIGLRNLGNTCFINSSLQCLSATIPLTDYFLGYDYRSEINKDNFLGTGGKLVVAYAELMKQMWLGSKSVVDPSSFKEQISTFAPQFSGYHQHDSQELLSYLLDGIHEDLNRVKSRPYVEDKDCDGTSDEQDAIEAWKNYLKRNKSLVVDLFQGQLRNTCKCLVCGHMNIRFEPFMYLSLPISDKANSLDDCMDLYLNEETLKGEDQWYCEKCKQHVDATKKSDLWILPPILIVHLKRFKYNDHGKVGSKNDKSISYPVNQWDLKRYVKSTRGIYPVYDLYAVSNHMGGLGGGHYTATTLNRFDDSWYEFNDSHYKTVAESLHQHQTKSAYVLFYNRSEGDASVPLNDRSPLIRRQSVSRPDLWPHTQMDDRNQVRNFTRSSRRLHENLMVNPLEVSKRRPMSKTGSRKQGQRTPATQPGPPTHPIPGGPRLKRPPSNKNNSSSYQTRSKTRSAQRSNSPDDRKRQSDQINERHEVKPDPDGNSPRRTKRLGKTSS